MRAATISPVVSSGPSFLQGWNDLAGTNLTSVGPDANCNSDATDGNGFGGIYDEWNSAAADPRASSAALYVGPAGGHNGYPCNEHYKLNLALATPAWTKVTSSTATTRNGSATCFESMADGTMNTRHTYDGYEVDYINGKIVMLGGLLECQPGDRADDIWTINVGSPKTHTLISASAITYKGGVFGIVSAFNPADNKIYYVTADGGDFYKFDASTGTNTGILTGREAGAVGQFANAAISTSDNLFVAIGGTAQVKINLATNAVSNIGLGASCNTLVNTDYPGITYDQNNNQIVGYPGTGNYIYIVNLSTLSCTTESVTNGVSGVGLADGGTNGIFGRFQFFKCGSGGSGSCFVACGDVGSNCKVYRR